MSSSTPTAEAGAPGDVPLVYVARRRLLMVAVIGISICQFLDATIANVAIPHMRTSLGASPDSISWVLTSFIIASAIVMPITGWLADRFGSRRVFLFACSLFLLSSALCGMATSLIEMVVFRVFQGAAAAMISPLSQTIVYDINPPSRQASAITLWGTAAMIAPVAGPYLGSVLTDALNWRWVFYINLPIGIPALAVIWAILPDRPRMHRQLDMFGFATVALGLGALQLMFDRGQAEDWFNSWEIIIELGIALSFLWIFAVRSATTPKPLFDRRLFANPTFLVSLVFMAAMGISTVAVSAILPTMYQTVFAYSVTLTGVLLAPRGLGAISALQVCNRLLRIMDPRLVICAGFLISGASIFGMTGWTLDMGYGPLLFANFAQGFAMVLVFNPVNLTAFGTLPADLRTDGSSLLTLTRNLGGSFGISYLVAALAEWTQRSHAQIGSYVTGSSLPGALDLGTASELAGDAGLAAIAMVDAEVTRQAMMLAYLDAFHLLGWLMLALAPLPLLMPRMRLPGMGGSESMAAAH